MPNEKTYQLIFKVLFGTIQATLIGVLGVFWKTHLSEKILKLPPLKILGKIFEKQGKHRNLG